MHFFAATLILATCTDIDGDVVRPSSVLRLLNAGAQLPYAFVTSDRFVAKEDWVSPKFVPYPRFEVDFRRTLDEVRDTHLVVVVDYHT